MIIVLQEENDVSVRRAPAEEVMIDGEPGENVFEVTFDDGLALQMPEEAARNLHRALNLYFENGIET